MNLEVESTMRTAKRLEFMGEILIMRTCDCGNRYACAMGELKSDGLTYIATYDQNEKSDLWTLG